MWKFKKVIIFSVLQMISLNNHSQTNNKWRDYYAFIDSAEIYVVDSMYQNAMSYYNKAFVLVDKPYGKDLYNAALCSNNIGAYKITTNLLNKLVDKGITKDYFEGNKYLTNYRNSESWKVFLNGYEAHRDTLRKYKNLDLRKQLSKMVSRDQYFARLKNTPGYGDSVFLVTDQNIKDIIRIIHDNGFPDENLIGLDELPSECLFEIILIHFQQCKAYFNDPKFVNSEKRNEFLQKGVNFNSINLDSILRVAIFQGKYNPTALYSLKGSTLLLQMDDTITIVNYDKQMLHHLDSIRKYYGLCDMALYQKKGMYHLQTIQFRQKQKNESVQDYIRSKYNHLEGQTSFNFGISISLSMFFKDGDKDHLHFRKVYNDLLKDPFSHKPRFTDFTPVTKKSRENLDLKFGLKGAQN
jgi:hypothetical protein